MRSRLAKLTWRVSLSVADTLVRPSSYLGHNAFPIRPSLSDRFGKGGKRVSETAAIEVTGLTRLRQTTAALLSAGVVAFAGIAIILAR